MNISSWDDRLVRTWYFLSPWTFNDVTSSMAESTVPPARDGYDDDDDVMMMEWAFGETLQKLRRATETRRHRCHCAVAQSRDVSARAKWWWLPARGGETKTTTTTISIFLSDLRYTLRAQPTDGNHHRIFHEEYSGGERGGGGSGEWGVVAEETQRATKCIVEYWKDFILKRQFL